MLECYRNIKLFLNLAILLAINSTYTKRISCNFILDYKTISFSTGLTTLSTANNNFITYSYIIFFIYNSYDIEWRGFPSHKICEKHELLPP